MRDLRPTYLCHIITELTRVMGTADEVRKACTRIRNREFEPFIRDCKFPFFLNGKELARMHCDLLNIISCATKALSSLESIHLHESEYHEDFKWKEEEDD